MKNIFLQVLIIAISSLVVAQSSRMVLSSTQLLVVPSAKHLSGGGADTAAGMDATFWNPAGLAMSENSIVQFFSSSVFCRH